MSHWLHFHQDNRVYIRNESDEPVYEATAAEFVLDHGAPFPLPEGVAQLELWDGRLYGYDAKQNELDLGALDPAPYIAILDALAQLQAARAARLAPTPAMVREQQRLAIEVERDNALLNDYVEWNGQRWDVNQTFQLHLTGLITAHGAGIVPDTTLHPIRTYDNTTLQLGITEIKGLAAAVLVKVQTIWQQSFAQKDALG